MGEQLEWRGVTDYDRRLDLGLQSAPRSTNIQGNRRKIKHMMASRNVWKGKAHSSPRDPASRSSWSPVPNPIYHLSYHPGDLQDPQAFLHCSRTASSRYSVPAGPSRGAWHFLLLVSNMGQFSELTLVRRQTTKVWLPTPGASDIQHHWHYSLFINQPLSWTDTIMTQWSRVPHVHYCLSGEGEPTSAKHHFSWKTLENSLILKDGF